MKNVKELALVVDQYVKRKIDVISNPNNYKTKVHQLYDGYRKGKYKHDREAAMDLFGTDDSNPSFKKLQQRLEDRLINSIFFIDSKAWGDSEYTKNLLKNNKYRALISTLTILGHAKIALPFISKALRQAEKLELTSNEIELRLAYGRALAQQGNLKKSKINYQRAIDLTEILRYEVINDGAIMEFNNLFQNPRKKDIELSAFLEEKLASIRTPTKKDSFRGIFMYYTLKVRYLTYSNKPNDLIKTVDFLKETLKFNSTSIDRRIQSALAIKIMALITLKQYSEAHQNVDHMIKLISSGTNNWFVFQLLKITILFKEKRYPDAYPYIKEALESPHINQTIAYNSERVKLFRAYVEFYVKLYKIDIKSPIKSKFSIARFLNQVPKQSKLKRKENIPILIIHVLLLFIEKRYEEAEARIDALAAYSQRHIKNNINVRSNAFIKMITIIPKSRYHLPTYKKKIRKYMNILSENPAPTITQSIDLEINSFENLIEDIFQLLLKRNN